MTSCGSNSSLTLSIISACSSNSNSHFPEPYRYLFTPPSQVIEIMQKMGEVRKKTLAPGDSECPVWISGWQNLSTSCMRRCQSHCVPWGCSSNLVILSWQSRCMLHNMLPFLAADIEFTAKEANFHPYCPVTLSEKSTISTAGMCWCFGEACSISFTSYITCRCCLASLRLCIEASVLTHRHLDQVHGLIWVWSYINGKQPEVT